MAEPTRPQPIGPTLTADERAAVRAYLQRSEVRLSTMHRVASALLSGAGIMVLLPTIERDSVVGVVRAELTGHLTGPRVLLLVATGVTVFLPVVALWLLLKELVRFYFHGEHRDGASGDEFLPRFTLTGLRVPVDELSDESRAVLDARRSDPALTRLIVPDNDRYRARLDAQRMLYHGTFDAPGSPLGEPTDRERVDLLLEFAASRERTLIEEAVKVEYGMVRHVLRTQVIVLRYAKALLVLVTTAGATFAASAVVQGSDPGSAGGSIGEFQAVALILACWAPVVVFTVTSPVQWLMRILKKDDAGARLVRNDRDITHFEDIAVRFALAGWFTATLAGITFAAQDGARSVGWTLTAHAVASVVLLGTFIRWDGRRFVLRLLGRHRAPGT